MDTDYLSREVYQGILIEAEKLTHDLTLHYGIISNDCDSESEYLEKAANITNEILNIDDNGLKELFWGNPPDKKKLHFTLKKIMSNIEKINEIPEEKRHYD